MHQFCPNLFLQLMSPHKTPRDSPRKTPRDSPRKTPRQGGPAWQVILCAVCERSCVCVQTSERFVSHCVGRTSKQRGWRMSQPQLPPLLCATWREAQGIFAVANRRSRRVLSCSGMCERMRARSRMVDTFATCASKQTHHNV